MKFSFSQIGSTDNVNYRRSYKVGEQIVAEGSKGDCAFLIISGRVEITISRKGRNVPVAVIGREEIFGEMALLTDEPRSATVTAVEPTVCVLINQSVLREKVMSADPLLRGLLRVLAGRLRDTLQLLEGAKQYQEYR